MSKRALLLMWTALLLLAVASAVAADSGMRITWSVVGSGGGHSASTHYQLDGTMGQAAPGLSNSTRYRLGSGYLYVLGLPPARQNRLFLPVIRKGSS